jgi:hypothetical protein
MSRPYSTRPSPATAWPTHTERSRLVEGDHTMRPVDVAARSSAGRPAKCHCTGGQREERKGKEDHSPLGKGGNRRHYSRPDKEAERGWASAHRTLFVATTVLLAVSITETLLLDLCAT